MTLLELAVDAHRFADRLGDDRRGRERADERTGDDELNRAGRDDPRRFVCLRDALHVERDIAVSLESALGVPVGLARGAENRMSEAGSARLIISRAPSLLDLRMHVLRKKIAAARGARRRGGQ